LSHVVTDLRGELRIAAAARWRENVEKKKVMRKKEKYGGEVFNELSHAE
jgi:hypothetical protein